VRDAPIILVADDDAGIRRALADALQNVGYAVEQASNGLMALKQIARQVPDLIVTDVRMPDLDGIGLATTLAPHAPPIPIIVMSADVRLYASAHPFIRKPFAVEALLTQNARALPVSAVVTVALSRLGATSRHPIPYRQISTVHA
jgi:CheY-like chemotaxis protein